MKLSFKDSLKGRFNNKERINMKIEQHLKHYLSAHWKRIKKLQNSKDPNKHELIALLAQEYSKAKQLLQAL